MPKSSFFANAIHVNFKQNAMNYHCDSYPISSSNYQLNIINGAVLYSERQ